MTANLLALLNANAYKSPDEIVKALPTHGWVQGSSISLEQHRQWVDEETVLAICNQRGGGPNWILNGRHYTMLSFDYQYVQDYLHSHWFIPSDKFQRGESPYPNGELS